MKNLITGLLFAVASTSVFAGETETVDQLPIVIFGETNQTAFAGETETVDQLPIVIFEENV